MQAWERCPQSNEQSNELSEIGRGDCCSLLQILLCCGFVVGGHSGSETFERILARRFVFCEKLGL
jgi:hypothetical protein